jgi:hypothetical protein
MGKPAPIKAGNKADTSARTAPAKTEKTIFKGQVRRYYNLSGYFNNLLKAKDK